MSLRIRKTGEIFCAAHTSAEEGDTYLNDDIHYYLSVLTGAIVASENHLEDNLWFWNIKEGEKPHYEEIKYWKETIGNKEIKCEHEWKDIGYYVETNRYDYECPFTGEISEEVEGYTAYDTTCIKCWEIKE